MRRTGISRNSIRKYLALLSADSNADPQEDNTDLAAKAYGSDKTIHDVTRLQQLIAHSKQTEGQFKKTGVTR